MDIKINKMNKYTTKVKEHQTFIEVVPLEKKLTFSKL